MRNGREKEIESLRSIPEVTLTVTVEIKLSQTSRRKEGGGDERIVRRGSIQNYVTGLPTQLPFSNLQETRCLGDRETNRIAEGITAFRTTQVE